MTVTLKIISYSEDVRCLHVLFHEPDAPSRRYGLEDRIGSRLSNGAIYLRHCMFPYEARLTAEGYARLLADLDQHEEAKLLALSPGEFFGLQLGAWRHARKIVFENTVPMDYWMLLVGFAYYKRERARRAGKLDEARRVLEAVDMLTQRYEGERELHAVSVFGRTVH
jgi:hypothetical protein